MHLTSRDEITEPLKNPTGEIVYELIGSSAEKGATDRHSLAHIVIPPGASSAPHYHQVSEETYYILRGTARMRIDGREFSLPPARVCLIKPGETHLITNEGEEELEFLAVSAPPWSPEDMHVQEES